jgi:large subunit ribosomal protein L17
MRHGKTVNHLSRTASHRRALLSNMAASLILHKRIKTTVAKAKALKKYVEPLLTKAKNDTTHSRRIVFSYLQNKEVLKELFGGVAEKIGTRPGGYTRIIRLGFRPGDNAEVAMIELVDYNDLLLDGKAEGGAKKKRTRRAGTGAAKATDKVTETTTANPKAPKAKADVAEDAEIVEETKTEQAEAKADAGEAKAAVETQSAEDQQNPDANNPENKEGTGNEEQEQNK